MKTIILKTVTRMAAMRNDSRGASLIEYALLVALIAIIAIFGVTQVGQKTLSNAASVLPALG